MVTIFTLGFIPGPNQAYSTHKCKKTQAEIGRGIYCSPFLESAEQYVKPFTFRDKQYTLIVMCRVDPKKVKFALENGTTSTYWVINKNEDIRAYALLFKEC